MNHKGKINERARGTNMVVILPDELKKKSEEMKKYMLSSGEWKADTPDFIKKYKEEIAEFINNESHDEM